MFENVKTYLEDVTNWLKRLFTIIYEFLGDIGVEA